MWFSCNGGGGVCVCVYFPWDPLFSFFWRCWCCSCVAHKMRSSRVIDFWYYFVFVPLEMPFASTALRSCLTAGEKQNPHVKCSPQSIVSGRLMQNKLFANVLIVLRTEPDKPRKTRRKTCGTPIRNARRAAERCKSPTRARCADEQKKNQNYRLNIRKRCDASEAITKNGQ